MGHCASISSSLSSTSPCILLNIILKLSGFSAGICSPYQILVTVLQVLADIVLCWFSVMEGVITALKDSLQVSSRGRIWAAVSHLSVLEGG